MLLVLYDDLTVAATISVCPLIYGIIVHSVPNKHKYSTYTQHKAAIQYQYWYRYWLTYLVPPCDVDFLIVSS